MSFLVAVFGSENAPMVLSSTYHYSHSMSNCGAVNESHYLCKNKRFLLSSESLQKITAKIGSEKRRKTSSFNSQNITFVLQLEALEMGLHL